MPSKHGTKYTQIGSHGHGGQKEDDDNIIVSNAMTTWTNLVGRSTPMCTVHNLRVEKEIRTPSAKYTTYVIILCHCYQNECDHADAFNE